MKKNFFKQTLITASLAGGMFFAGTAFTQGAQPQAQELPGDLTQQQVQQWVQGLQTVFPYYQVSLESYESQGDRAQANIVFVLGQRNVHSSNAAARTELGGLYARFDMPVEIERGISFEDGRFSIARVRLSSALSAESSAELVELYGTAPLTEAQGIMSPTGDLVLSFNEAGPFNRAINDQVAISVPSYTGSFYSYNGAQLGHIEALVPQIIVRDVQGDAPVAVVENVRMVQHDKPLRQGIYELNGRTEIEIERIAVQRKLDTIFTLGDFRYVEDAVVDEDGLYQSALSMSGHGVVGAFAPGRQAHEFSFDMAGSIRNLPGQGYIDLVRRLTDGSFYTMEQAELKGYLFDLLQHNPGMDIEKYTVVIDGFQGDFKGSIGIAPFTQDDRRMEFILLLMQKLQVNASADIPVQWVELFGGADGERLVQRLIDQGYVTRNGDRLTSTFVYEQGNMTVNGQPLQGLF